VAAIAGWTTNNTGEQPVFDHAAGRAEPMILPAGPFDLLYADPPLYWTGWSPKGEGRSPQHHYRCPPMSDLLALPFADIAAPNAVLAIWVYGPRLPDTLALIGGWGFAYQSEGFVWVKVDKQGRPRMGCGKSTRKESESLWLATRGTGLRRVDMGVRQVIFAPRGAHSRKPDEAAHRLERLHGPVRRIELFAREHRPGWASWGDELPDDALSSVPATDVRSAQLDLPLVKEVPQSRH
jgi:N6-adenosine-specific RNA methylase IME4